MIGSAHHLQPSLVFENIMHVQIDLCIIVQNIRFVILPLGQQMRVSEGMNDCSCIGVVAAQLLLLVLLLHFLGFIITTYSPILFVQSC